MKGKQTKKLEVKQVRADAQPKSGVAVSTDVRAGIVAFSPEGLEKSYTYR